MTRKIAITILLSILLITMSSCTSVRTVNDSTNLEENGNAEVTTTKSEGWKIDDYSQSLNAQTQRFSDVRSISTDKNAIIISAFNDLTEHILKLEDEKFTEIAYFDRFSSNDTVYGKKLNVTVNPVGHYQTEKGLRIVGQDNIIDVENEEAKVTDLNLPDGSARTYYLGEIVNRFAALQNDETFLSTDWGRTYIYKNSPELSDATYPGWVDASVTENNDMWISTGNEILKWNGTGFEKKFESRPIDDTTIESRAVIYVQGLQAERQITIDSLYVINDNDIYILMYNKIYHYNGNNWTLEYENPNSAFATVRGDKETIVTVGPSGIIVAKEIGKDWNVVRNTNYSLGTLHQVHFTKDGFWAGGQSLLYFVHR